MNLWMIYICRSDLESTVRGDRKKVNVLYIVDWNNKRSVIAVNHFRNFKGIWLMVVTMEKYLSRKKKLMFEIEKKESQKLKSLSKFTIYILDEQEPSVRSAANRTKTVQVWSCRMTYLPKSGNWPLQHIWKKVDSLLERISPKILFMSASSQIMELHETINF